MIVDLDGGGSSVLASVEGGNGSDILGVANLKDGGKVELLGGDDESTITTAKGGYTVDAGAGDDIISGNIVAEKTTVINGGEGGDEVSFSNVVDYTKTKTKLTVDLGAGDDFVNAGSLNGITSGFNFVGGDGNDTIRITSAFGLLEANRISGFEAIDVTGNISTVDMSRESDLKSVVVDASVLNAI